MTSTQLPLEADSSPVEEFMPVFYVGHHESKRRLPVTDFVLRQAQDVGVSSFLLTRNYLLTTLV
jgi:protein arginine N-methyltransferase 5